MLSLSLMMLGGCSGAAGRGEQIERRLHDASFAAWSVCFGRPTTPGGLGLDSLARARAVDRGDIVVDEAAIDACVAAISTCTIGAVHQCDWAFSGQVREGGACEVSDACASGLVCSCGVCVAGTPLGAACTSSNECLRSTPRARPSCEAGVCVETVFEDERAGLGEPCGAVEESANHYVTTSCEVGLACGESGVCEVFSAPEGTECLGDSRCDLGLACLEGHCTATTTVALGEECDDPARLTSPFRVCEATEGAVCLFGICSLVPGEVGADCSWVFGCLNGLVCARGTCHVPVPVGGECDSELLCETLQCIEGRCAASCL